MKIINFSVKLNSIVNNISWNNIQNVISILKLVIHEGLDGGPKIANC